MDTEEKTRFDGGSAATLEPPTGGDEPSAAPLRVGRYFIFKQIAEGGMGQVLLAYDETLDRKLAIKLWRPQAMRGEDLRARMLREAQALARLSHPNVVHVYEVGDHQDLLYLAMEYVEGRTLREWIRADRPELTRILERFIQAGQGLAAAHRAGVLHRDFKPDNAVVGDDGRVRVLDFGLARADSHGPGASGPRPAVEAMLLAPDAFDNPITRAGSVLGTPAYMPPEQLAGRETDARSDLYSFCVALWEAIHGLRPFVGATAKELAAAIHAQRPRESDRPVPGWLRAALLRGLAPAPDARWPTMDALLGTLSAGARRRRRRVGVVVALGVLALIGAVAAVVLVGQARTVAMCEARGAAISEVWDEHSRAAIRTTLLASGQSFAAGSAERVDTLLAGYVDTWSKGQVDACRRVHVERTWDAVTGERADACLDERRLELAGLVGVLQEPDAALARRAIEAATALPTVALCLDVDVLARRPQLPRDEAARAEAVAIRRELARARSLEAAGRYAEGLALLEDLIVRADALGWAPLRAQARLMAGGAAISLGERDTAAVAGRLEDALFLALDAGHDAMAGEAAIELLHYSGLTLLRLAEGERWARLARSLLLRLGAEGVVLAADLECGAAELDKVRSRFAASAAGFDRCHAARLAAYGPDHPSLAHALSDRAGLAQLQGAHAEAADLLRRALAGLEPVMGRDHPSIARVLASLGEVLISLGETAEAEVVLQRALTIDTEVFGDEHERVGSDHYALGTLYLTLGRNSDAIQHLGRAVALFEGVPGMGRPMQVAALDDLATAYHGLGDLDRAVDAARRSLALYEGAVGAKHASLAPALIKVATLLRERGHAEPDEAIDLLTRAVELLATEETRAQRGAARFELARAWSERGDRARARELARKAADELAGLDPARHAEVQAWLAAATP